MGLTPAQTYRYVILPQAFRIILPPLTCEFMNVIKNSSVALTIGLLELTGRRPRDAGVQLPGIRGVRRRHRHLPPHQPLVVLFMRWIEAAVRVPGLIAAGGASQAGH